MTPNHRLPVSRLLLLLAAAATISIPAQAQQWEVGIRALHVSPDGHFSDRRENGKLVESRLEPSLSIAISVSRGLSESVSVGVEYTGAASYDFVIHQDFPDGTEFESRDASDYHAVAVHVPILIREIAPRLHWWFEPSVGISFKSDVTLASSGNAYDRTDPIAVDVSRALRVGMMTTIEYALGPVSLEALTGFAVERFQGQFPDDPTAPGIGGDIDVAFNPVVFGLGVRIEM